MGPFFICCDHPHCQQDAVPVQRAVAFGPFGSQATIIASPVATALRYQRGVTCYRVISTGSTSRPSSPISSTPRTRNMSPQRQPLSSQHCERPWTAAEGRQSMSCIGYKKPAKSTDFGIE